MSDLDDDFETVAPSSPSVSAGPSLKARAIGFLSRREHSRRELERKLSPYAPDRQALHSLLDELARENWQSDERFAQSLINRRASRHGWQRIAHELRQHGISDTYIGDLEPDLTASETDRASEVWDKKFGERPADAKAYAKQYRFMASRGFSAASVRKVLGDVPT